MKIITRLVLIAAFIAAIEIPFSIWEDMIKPAYMGSADYRAMAKAIYAGHMIGRCAWVYVAVVIMLPWYSYVARPPR